MSRFRERFAGPLFALRLLFWTSLALVVADPGRFVAEVHGIGRRGLSERTVPAMNQLIYALHEAGHVIVARAARPDGMLVMSVVYDRSARTDGDAAGFARYFFPPAQVSRENLMAFWMHCEAGKAAESFYFDSVGCRAFAELVDPYYDSDTLVVLTDVAAAYGYRYSPYWAAIPSEFGRRSEYPDEVKALRILQEARARAYALVEANQEAVTALALALYLDRPRHGMKVVTESDLVRVERAHPLRLARCK